MSEIHEARPGNPAPVEPTGAGEGGLRAWLHSVKQGLKQVVGIPDYERYLAHHAEHHPGEPPMTQEEFVAKAIDRKYCGSGPRCC